MIVGKTLFAPDAQRGLEAGFCFLQILNTIAGRLPGEKKTQIILRDSPIERKVLLGSYAQSSFVGIDRLLQIPGAITTGQFGIRNSEIVLGLSPIERKVLLGLYAQSRLKGIDGLLQVPGAITTGRFRIRNSEVVLGPSPPYLVCFRVYIPC
jgi:hypothetical protein